MAKEGFKDGLAAQIRILLADPAAAAAMGRAGAALASTRFSPEAHYQTLLAIYDELQSSPGRAAGLRPPR